MSNESSKNLKCTDKSQKQSSYPIGLEFFKCNFDYFKHLTNLSTGSILMIAIFFEKVFSKPILKQAIVISIAGFLITIISSVVAYTVSVTTFTNPWNKSTNIEIRVIATSITIALIGFLAGIISLAIFILFNLASS